MATDNYAIGKQEPETLLQTLRNLDVVYAGDSTSGATSKTGSRSDGVYQLDYFYSGCGQVIIGGRPYRIRPYDIFIVNPQDQYRLLTTKEVVRSMSIRFQLSGDRCGPVFPNHYGNLGNLSHNRRGELDHLLRRACLEANRPGDESPHLARGFLIAFFGLSCQCAANLERLPDPDRELSSNRRILEYIKQHYDRQITLGDLARVAGLDPEYLCHRFSTEFGCTPMEALTRERVEVAKNLLSNTRLSIAEVGVQSGYLDVYHFSKRFKEVVGMSPRQFRRRPTTTGRFLERENKKLYKK